MGTSTCFAHAQIELRVRKPFGSIPLAEPGIAPGVSELKNERSSAKRIGGFRYGPISSVFRSDEVCIHRAFDRVRSAKEINTQTRHYLIAVIHDRDIAIGDCPKDAVSEPLSLTVKDSLRSTLRVDQRGRRGPSGKNSSDRTQPRGDTAPVCHSEIPRSHDASCDRVRVLKKFALRCCQFEIGEHQHQGASPQRVRSMQFFTTATLPLTDSNAANSWLGTHGHKGLRLQLLSRPTNGLIARQGVHGRQRHGVYFVQRRSSERQDFVYRFDVRSADGSNLRPGSRSRCGLQRSLARAVLIPTTCGGVSLGRGLGVELRVVARLAKLLELGLHSRDSRRREGLPQRNGFIVLQQTASSIQRSQKRTWHPAIAFLLNFGVGKDTESYRPVTCLSTSSIANCDRRAHTPASAL